MATTTLRELNGFDETPATLSNATLILVDYQNTYTSGVMELDGWKPALETATALLTAARAAGTPVIHVRDGGYDITSEAGQIHQDVAPIEGEEIVTKSVPNGFHKTDLGKFVDAAGNENVIVAGFMTNMCTLFTAQGAFLNGNKPTVVADASATRALATAVKDGKELTAQQIHDGALATVTELYGVVTDSKHLI